MAVASYKSNKIDTQMLQTNELYRNVRKQIPEVNFQIAPRL